jgi:hypothetical protein
MAIVTAGSFQPTRSYTIYTLGVGTDFTLIGASSNTVGVTFIATGVGTGTGTAVLNEFGLKLYKSNGLVAYDSNSVTWNQVDQVYVAGSSSGTFTYPLLINKEILIVQMLIDPPPVDRKAVAHNITTNNTTGVISISGGSENAYFWVLMR